MALYSGDWRKAGDLEFNRPADLRDVDFNLLPSFAIQWYGFKTREFDWATAFLKRAYQLTEGQEFDVDADAAMALTILTQQRGDTAGTKRLINNARRSLKVDSSSNTPDLHIIYRAKLHVLEAQYALALDDLTKLAQAKFADFPYAWTLDKDPVWDPIRTDQRFQAVEKQYRDDTAQQQNLLQEMRRKGEVPQRNSP